MGIFSKLKKRFEIKNKEAEIKLRTLELEQQAMDALLTLNSEEGLNEAFNTSDYRATMGRKDTRWEDIGGDVFMGGTELSENKLKILRDQSRKMWETDPLANNIIESSVDFVTGKGIAIGLELDKTVFPKKEQREKLKAQAKEYWEAFKKVNKFDNIIPEFSRRAFRDGEFFIRWFYPQGSFTDMYDTIPQIRFIEPERIKDPNGQIPFGIKVSDDDYHKVEFYCLSKGSRYDKIPAEEIIHFKVRADANDMRGRAILFPVLKHLTYYQQWLRYRIILNKIRTAIVMIRQVKGSPNAITSLRAGTQATTTAKTTKAQALEAGTIITAPEGVEYKFMSPQLDARDAGSDGREIKLAIAAGVGFPEMFATSDFSNSTYSSSLTAQNPMIRKFTAWQETFGRFYSEVYARVIENGKQFWTLPKEMPTKAKVEFGTLIHREIKQDAEAYKIAVEAGALSRKTMSERLGFDYDVERTNMAMETEEALYALPELEEGL
jgi:capsid protein